MKRIKNKCSKCGTEIYDMELIADEYTIPDDPREYQLYQCKCGKRFLHFYDADLDQDFNWEL